MSEILTIYSAEEKIGKTMFGINLAVSLINETQKSVIFVDLGTDENRTPAWSMLKLSPDKPLQRNDLTLEGIKARVLTHSSQLSLLHIDETIIRDETTVSEFVWSLFHVLKEMFDYIFVDFSSHLTHIAYEVIDESDIFIIVASSLEYEQPIGIVGHRNFRLVVNLCEDAPVQHSDYYILPQDAVALEAFRRSGIPFVIQAPHRPISQIIGRLARDVGEKQFGLALIGGAALGLTQLGILEVLERNRIALDMITGAGFGALIGGAHAAGIELRLIKQHFVEWAQTCRPPSKFPLLNTLRKRFSNNKGLDTLCDTFLKDTYFEELFLPVNVVAIDIRTGAGVVFREGRVLDAVKSSMRIPNLFIPFKDTERHLIDGSVIYPTPVAPLKIMGADITIGVNVMPTPAESQQYFRQHIEKGRLTPAQRAAKKNYALVAATFDSLMERLLDLPESLDTVERVSPDLFIVPDITGITWRDFHRIDELIDLGAKAAEEIISQIETLKWG